MVQASPPETDRWPGGTLRATGVSRAFEGVQALREVSLELHRHEVVGLIGPNGAGKTTLVNILTGFDFPDAGTVELGEREITKWTPARRGRTGLARTFQHSRSFRNLTVRENVEVAALGSGARNREARRRSDQLLGLFGLGGHADVPASALAHGDERKLGVARALATAPHFVLLDEPAAGLTELEGEELVAILRGVLDDFGCGILLIEHEMSVVMSLCPLIQVLDDGVTLKVGAPEEIQADPSVIEAYLGSSYLEVASA